MADEDDRQMEGSREVELKEGGYAQINPLTTQPPPPPPPSEAEKDE